MKRMSNLTDKFVADITLFTQMLVSFLVEKKYICLSLTGLVGFRRQEGLKRWIILSMVN